MPKAGKDSKSAKAPKRNAKSKAKPTGRGKAKAAKVESPESAPKRKRGK